MLFPKKGWIGIKIAAQMAGKEQGLAVGNQAQVDFFIEEGMAEFLAFAFLPGDEDGFSCVGIHLDGTGFGDAKARGGHLASVDERQRKAVGEGGAKFFHKIEGEAFSPRAVAVEKPGARIKPV